MTSKILFICIGVLSLVSDAFGQDGYRCVDQELRLDVVHSDPKAFYISMDMDPRGNLYVGGRDAVYLFEADGKGGFKPRRTLTTLPPHTWAYSLQVAGDDLYVLTVTALYRMPNVIRDPAKVTFERLVWGIPLGHIHQGFHGMKMGPGGSFYLAFGDPQPGPFRRKTNPGHVWHWTFLSGPGARKMPWTGVGGVIRYDPKSHELETISRGYRNICDLDFDEHWNLFGNDNDQEGSALHSFGRLTHVTEGSHYQWSRGWLQVKEPYRNDLIQTIDPNLGRFVPFGTCYYTEDHLGDAYRRSLFVARWGSRELGHFPLTPRGASFTSSQKPLLVGKKTARPVAVFTGNDGRLFVSVCFMQRNEASPVKKTDLVMISNPKKPLKLSALAPATTDTRTLLDEIESPSWKRRFNAHRELVSRGISGDPQVPERFLKCRPGSPAWFSLAWLAGSHDNPQVKAALGRSLSSANPQVVATAADTLRRFHQLSESQVHSLLASDSPIAQLAGLRAAGEPVPRVNASLGESINELAMSSDSMVRQAAQRWLGRHMTWSQLEQRFNAGNLPLRRVTLAAAMWKWNDMVEYGTIPDGVTISPPAAKMLNGFGYVDDPKSNLKTESEKHGFKVGGLPMMDWWKQAASANPDAPEIGVIKRMITQAIYDTNDAHRKTAAVFANTLGMNDLASRIPGLTQTRTIKADIAKGAKLSANKAMPPAYQAIDWTTAWKKGNVKTGAAIFKKSCVACHDSGEGGGVIGPSLAGVAKRFTPQYLAQSVAAPSKDVSPNFQSWKILLHDGRVLLGFLSGEDENRVTLQMMDGALKAVEKSQIEQKKPSGTSLMPVGLIKSPEELKHIVSYLMTLRTSGAAASFIDLLAGGDLKDHFETTGNWSLGEDGVVQLQPREGEKDWLRYGDYLWLKNEYKDFQFEFEYRHETGGNSGLYFNVTDRKKAVGTVIEVQIRDSADAKILNAHGVTGGILPKIDPKANATKAAGEWNHMSVTSIGGEVTVRLNGVLVNHVKLSHPELTDKPKQGFIGFQDHGLPFWLRKVRIRELAATVSVPDVPKKPAVTNGVGPINAAIANAFPFAPTEARFVRVQIIDANLGQPCIDELEIFAPGSSKNLALQSENAKATASSLLKGYDRHKIEYLNDGRYGNDRSWIAAEKTGWAQIELAKPTKIDRVVLSRDRGGKLFDRTPTAFDILISNDGKAWKTVKEVRPRKANSPAPKRDPTPPKSSAKPSRPNVIVVFVDDLGWTDLGCYGSKFYETPNIDGLAEQGALFRKAYSSCNVCSPTRASLMTGKYPQRIGFTSWLNPRNPSGPNSAATYIPPGEKTIGEAFQEAGYRTGYIGKWHVGSETIGMPKQHGFDWQMATAKHGLPGSYFHPYKRKGLPSADVPDLEDGKPGDYLSDVLTEKGIGFIRETVKEGKKPFFLILGHYAVHTPIQAPAELVKKYESKKKRIYGDTPLEMIPERFNRKVPARQQNPTYAGMMENLDTNVGRVIDALDQLGLTKDTIIVFTSDNGGSCMPGSPEKRPTSNYPLRASKGWNYEGGIRIPTFITWPGKIAAMETAEPVITMDLYPTLLELTGCKPLPNQTVDGRSLVPLIRGEKKRLDRPFLAWWYPHANGHGTQPCQAILKDGWKLIHWMQQNETELYRLDKDEGERNDLAKAEPEKAHELLETLNQWVKETGRN